MAGSPGTRLSPDPAQGPRAALIIATTSYQDPELRQLRAPAHDAEDLAEVLADPGIGGFTVTSMIDADERQARRAIDVFLSSRDVGDVVVVYLSCHGVLDRRNDLYFAATDTIKTQLSSTGIESAWLLKRLEDCRARNQVLILDCCFSGAFAHGSKGDDDLDLERRLAGHGRGQAVLTASRAGEYSFEGQVLPGAAVSGSVFTAGLVKGLRTGDADASGDGVVSVDEAYDYAYRYVQSSGASQTPQRWLSGGEGAIVLARSPTGMIITPDLAAVNALGDLVFGDDLDRAVTAEQKLRQIARTTDKPAVADATRFYLTSAARLALTEAATPTSTRPVTSRKPRDLATDDAIELIARLVSQMRCILFLGPGAHAPPPAHSRFEYPAAQRPLVGAHLSLKLAEYWHFSEQSPSEDPTNLQKVAQFYEIRHSRHQLVDAIKDEVQTGKRPSPLLRLLAELGFPLVITTNYDQLFEDALIAAGKQPRVAVYTPNLEPTTDYRDPTAESPVVLKIHGDILRPETIVITDEDYIQFGLRMSSKDPYDPVPLTLRYYLTTWTSLFVGYDQFDYNVRVLLQTLRWKIDSASVPDMYSVDYHPDPLVLDVWQNQRRYMKFIAQDLWTFLPGLYERVVGKEFQL